MSKLAVIVNYYLISIFLRFSLNLKAHKELLLLFILFPLLSYAQVTPPSFNINLKHWDVADGLSHRRVNTVFQDSKGFIWVGTQYGLNRFDGHNFKIFSKEINGLVSNEIISIDEDSEGWLWLVSSRFPNYNQSLCFVNIHTYQIKTVEERFGNDLPFSPNLLQNVLVNDQGVVFMSVENKIYSYQNKVFTLLQKFEKPIFLQDFNNSTNRLLGYEKTSSQTINVFELENKTLASTSIFETVDAPTIHLFYDKSGGSWLTMETGLFFKEKGELTWNEVELKELINTDKYLSENLIECNIIYAQFFWCINETHLLVFDTKTDFQLDIGVAHPEILNANILGLYPDKFNNIWIATEFGLYKLNISENPFKNYLNQPVEEYDVQTTFSARGLSIMQNQLWANSVNGLEYLVDLDSNHVEELTVEEGVAVNGSVEDVIFYPIHQISDEEYLTTDLNIVKYKNGTPAKIYHWKDGQKLSQSWAIFKDKENIWLGLFYDGIAKVENDSISTYRNLNGFENLARSATYHFMKWNEELLLLATTSGIYVLNQEEGIIQRFWTGGDDNTFIPYDQIYHLNRDKNQKDIVWAATAGGGLLKITLDSVNISVRKTEQFTTVNGLSNNVLYAVYPDEYQNLWLTSDYGIMRFNTTYQTVKSYTTADGLPFNEFNRISHYQAKNGLLFFGTMNGVTSFHPKDLIVGDKELSPPLRITQFQQFNGELNKLENRTAELILNEEIILQPRDQFLILNFALLTYDEVDQIKYSYQIEGQNKQWISLNSNELRLSGLPYGTFTLSIRAVGVSSQFSSQVLSIPITVRRPFYLRWWFFTLLFISSIAIIYFWYLSRTKSFIARQKELEEEVSKRTHELEEDKRIIETQADELKNLDQLKSRFFANVSHELRTPLTLIVAPIQEILSQQQLDSKLRSNLGLVDKNSKKLQKMVNEILSLSKLESGKMTLQEEKIEWYQYVKQIYVAFESLASYKEIDYQYHFEGNTDTTITLDKEKANIIFNNLLSNAFKFTDHQGKIDVHAGITERTIYLSVSNTGRGILPDDIPHIFNRFYQTKNKNQAAEGGTGIGLALVKELAKILNGKITVESEPNAVTSFHLQLPLQQVEKADLPQESTISVLPVADESINSPSEKKVITGNAVTILLVEDNLDLSFFIRSILEEYYHVLTAMNGKEALEKIHQNPDIQLVLSDVMMPIMDGFQLLEKLKSDVAYKHLPVIMLTAMAAMKDKLKALRIGVDDYLTKPFVKEELLARIDNLLRNATGRKEAKLIEATETQQQDISETDEETQKWLDRLEEVVLKNIELSEFTIDDVAIEMFTSKRQLYRLIQQNIGMTPLQYVKNYKLNFARSLLENQQVKSVKVASYSIGYANVVYFRREFKKAFGRNPSEYLA